jgi:hypothetical protein
MHQIAIFYVIMIFSVPITVYSIGCHNNQELCSSLLYGFDW